MKDQLDRVSEVIRDSINKHLGLEGYDVAIVYSSDGTFEADCANLDNLPASSLRKLEQGQTHIADDEKYRIKLQSVKKNNQLVFVVDTEF